MQGERLKVRGKRLEVRGWRQKKEEIGIVEGWNNGVVRKVTGYKLQVPSLENESVSCGLGNFQWQRAELRDFFEMSI